MLTKERCLEMIDRLSKVFDVPAPGLRWSPLVEKGWYYPSIQVIRQGPKSWRGEASVLHEFAHHLMTSRGIPGCHNPRFFQVLLEVAEAWYGDVSLYSWQTEYRRIYRWYSAIGEANRMIDEALLSEVKEIAGRLGLKRLNMRSGGVRFTGEQAHDTELIDAAQRLAPGVTVEAYLVRKTGIHALRIKPAQQEAPATE